MKMSTNNLKGISKTKLVVTVGIFSAISFVLQLIVPYKVSGFLDVELSDLPPLILSLAYGPLFGVLAELIKNILHCFVTTTGFVGEFANFVINGVLCLVTGFVYKFHKNFKGAIVALLLGVVSMVVAGAFANRFVMLPLYMQGVDTQTYINLIMTVIVPFNIGKGLILSLITFLLYKKVSKVIK